MRVNDPGRSRGREPIFKGGAPVLTLAYVIGELVVFGLVSDRIGFFPALLLAFAKSVLGFMILGAFMRALLGLLARSGGGVFRLEGGGLGQRLLGALFLVLPGFLSAIIAAALLVPGWRDYAAGAMAARRPPDGVIELSEDDWREIQDEKAGSRRRLRRPRP